ncbi:MAG TPA: protein translocase subunit SecD [Kiloniellales bacterium]|jgi:protein-export membrane protein SecD
MVQYPRWQVILVMVVLLLGAAFAAPNLLSRDAAGNLPNWIPREQINLGLDLQGGSYLLMEVDFDSVVRERLDTLVDSVRTELRKARIGYSELSASGTSISFRVSDLQSVDAAREAIRDSAQEFAMDAGADGAFRLQYNEQSLRELRTNVLSHSLEIVRRRIDETGTREPSIQRQGDDRILVQLPGLRDPERIKALLGKTAKLTFRMVDESSVGDGTRVPAGSEILPSDELDPTGTPRRYVVKKRIMVSGDTLTDAAATFQDGQPVVSFSFDSVGAKRFGDATKENVGRPFAIVLDNTVISAPVIREPILGGRGVISGRFTVQEVQDLALLLRAGALPAPLTILEERTIGPGLGADSIEAGKIASILGFVFVVIFMAAVYGLLGAMADVALVVNLVLILAVLSGLQATLTLPGIAGIVLTLGMAVDANVLIFERVREEVAGGRGPVTAIDAGYRRAMSTIVDSNLTTLIAALLLFQFGTGPIKGFAITLAIGLVTSMFTAIMLTRLMVVVWLRRWRPQQLAI